MSKLPVPIHATQDYGIAHRDIFAPAVTAAIMSEIPNIAKAVGEYLRAAARSHPIMRGGHCHSVITRMIVGSYSFVLTSEEGYQEHQHVRYLPAVNGDLSEWYWHFSVIRVHEDTGAMLPMQLDEAVRFAEMILEQEVWADWFHYGVNPAEPLVIHAFIPYREERENGI